MKICAIADSHGFLVDIPKCDLFIIAGDISWDNNYKWFKDTFIKYLIRQKPNYDKCIIVFGNHDDNIFMGNDNIRDGLPKYVSILENSYCYYKRFKIYGTSASKYLPSFKNTYLEPKLRDIYSKIPNDTDILVTHSPPYGIGDSIKTTNPLDWHEHLGSVSLLERVREVKPKLHIFGHIHTGNKYTRENGTDYFNVSITNEDYDIAYIPTIIEINKEDINMNMYYCPTCKKPARKITTIETEVPHRHLVWNGEFYAVVDSNDDQIKTNTYCGICKTLIKSE